MAKRTRSKRLQFEALEERITLTTGILHQQVAVAVQQVSPVKGTFHGTASVLKGTNVLLVQGLNGTLGKAKFNGFINAIVSGTHLFGGELHLTNPHGTLLASISSGNVTGSGKNHQLKAVIVFDQGTGSFSAVPGSAGTIAFQFTGNPGLDAANDVEERFALLIASAIALAKYELLHPPKP